MTEKLWEIIDEEFISYTGGTAQLISNGECKVHLWETPKDAQLFCDKLNALHEENQQLKEHQRTLEAKIVRLKDRVKTFEKHYSLKDIERYKKMDNCNCITSKRLEE